MRKQCSPEHGQCRRLLANPIVWIFRDTIRRANNHHNDLRFLPEISFILQNLKKRNNHHCYIERNKNGITLIYAVHIPLDMQRIRVSEPKLPALFLSRVENSLSLSLSLSYQSRAYWCRYLENGKNKNREPCNIDQTGLFNKVYNFIHAIFNQSWAFLFLHIDMGRENYVGEIPVPIRHHFLGGKCKVRVLSASERSKGTEGESGSEALAETEKSQTSQPGIEPGTPANAVDALPLSHRDKRHHQLVCLTLLSALPPLHNKGIIHCPQTNPLRSAGGGGGGGGVTVAIVHPARPEKIVVYGVNAKSALSTSERSKVRFCQSFTSNFPASLPFPFSFSLSLVHRSWFIPAIWACSTMTPPLSWLLSKKKRKRKKENNELQAQLSNVSLASEVKQRRMCQAGKIF